MDNVQDIDPMTIDRRTKEFKNWLKSQKEVDSESQPKTIVTPRQEKPVIQVKPMTKPTKTQEDLQREIEESKKRFAQAQKELDELQKVEFNESNDYYDQTTIPQEIKDAYPKAHFHWSRTKTRDYNKAIRLGYQFVRIPESCRDLIKAMELNTSPYLKNTFGSNILLNDSGENVCMWCPMDRWKHRLEQRERKSKSMSNYRVNAEISQLERGNKEMGISGISGRRGIKEVQMYVHDDK